MNNAQTLMIITAIMSLLSLGCLAFMRRQGYLTLKGLLWSIFFAVGSVAGLYLLLTG